MTLGLGQKVKYHKILVNMSISKIFIPNFVCVVQMKYTTQNIQHISDRIFILLPWSCPKGGTFGRWGARGVFFQT